MIYNPGVGGRASPVGPHLSEAEMAGDACDVCGTGKSIGVACVPAVPISVAYCKKCLNHGAHPYGILRTNVALCGGREHCAPWFLAMNVFLDGEYMPLSVALDKYPLTDDELNMGPVPDENEVEDPERRTH
jgi:hypothetical protein